MIHRFRRENGTVPFAYSANKKTGRTRKRGADFYPDGMAALLLAPLRTTVQLHALAEIGLDDDTLGDSSAPRAGLESALGVKVTATR